MHLFGAFASECLVQSQGLGYSNYRHEELPVLDSAIC
jgi:hypothetical protein